MLWCTVVCLGKRQRPVSFHTDGTTNDSEALIKKIREEFQDCLESSCDIILQLKE